MIRLTMYKFLKTNMKKSRVAKLWLLVFIINCLFLFSVNSNAQCKYVAINLNSDTSIYNIPCDFPIIENTGNINSDNYNYVIPFSNWSRNAASLNEVYIPTLVDTYISKVYFEISTITFNQFGEVRKNKILASSQLYKILQ